MNLLSTVWLTCLLNCRMTLCRVEWVEFSYTLVSLTCSLITKPSVTGFFSTRGICGCFLVMQFSWLRGISRWSNGIRTQKLIKMNGYAGKEVVHWIVLGSWNRLIWKRHFIFFLWFVRMASNIRYFLITHQFLLSYSSSLGEDGQVFGVMYWTVISTVPIL